MQNEYRVKITFDEPNTPPLFLPITEIDAIHFDYGVKSLELEYLTTRCFLKEAK